MASLQVGSLHGLKHRHRFVLNILQQTTVAEVIVSGTYIRHSYYGDSIVWLVDERLASLTALHWLALYSEVLSFSSFLAQLGILNNCRLSVWLRYKIL